jgi:hypothetical protein
MRYTLQCVRESTLEGVMTDPQFISVPEFIARTNGGVSKSLVYDLLNRGELEGVRLSARKWLIRVDALEVLRARQREG